MAYSLIELKVRFVPGPIPTGEICGLGNKHVRVHVVFLPVARDEIIPALLAGRGDIGAAGLTITPERAKVISFSDPVSKTISEVLVTGPLAPKIDKVEDLSGHEIHVRASSSYRSSLDMLNERLQQQGLEKIEIVDAPEQLEDEDLLEMINAGLLEWAVVDNFKARAWTNVFENLVVRDDLTFRTGALGIMQLLPSTAADPNVGIPDISTAESNIHAGVKYLDFIRDRYFSDPEIDKFNQTMLAFAAYNAGPAGIWKLRGMAAEQGYDPNIWFDNVEILAAQDIGRETVQNVANILKYYVAYSLTIQQQIKRKKSRLEAGIE